MQDCISVSVGIFRPDRARSCRKSSTTRQCAVKGIQARTLLSAGFSPDGHTHWTRVAIEVSPNRSVLSRPVQQVLVAPNITILANQTAPETSINHHGFHRIISGPLAQRHGHCLLKLPHRIHRSLLSSRPIRSDGSTDHRDSKAMAAHVQCRKELGAAYGHRFRGDLWLSGLSG